jgi:periplasmic divalent cation tolerance protein
MLYVPCGSEDEAIRLARGLIEKRLIACANVYESRSLYRWEGKIADGREHVLICKTARSRAEAAQREIKQAHSYDIPCVIQIDPASVNHEYVKWVIGEVYAGDALTQHASS